MIRTNYIFSIITILFSLFFLYMTTYIPVSSSTYTTGPKFWPSIILILMLVLGISLFIKTFIQSRKMDEGSTEETDSEEHSIKKYFNVQMSVISTVIVGIYVFFLNLVGFIISTLVFVFVMSLLLGMKKKVSSIILAIVSTAVIVYLFSILLNIPLPRGIGIFREISLLFY